MASAKVCPKPNDGPPDSSIPIEEDEVHAPPPGDFALNCTCMQRFFKLMGLGCDRVAWILFLFTLLNIALNAYIHAYFLIGLAGTLSGMTIATMDLGYEGLKEPKAGLEKVASYVNYTKSMRGDCWKCVNPYNGCRDCFPCKGKDCVYCKGKVNPKTGINCQAECTHCFEKPLITPCCPGYSGLLDKTCSMGIIGSCLDPKVSVDMKSCTECGCHGSTDTRCLRALVFNDFLKCPPPPAKTETPTTFPTQIGATYTPTPGPPTHMPTAVPTKFPTAENATWAPTNPPSAMPTEQKLSSTCALCESLGAASCFKSSIACGFLDEEGTYQADLASCNVAQFMCASCYEPLVCPTALPPTPCLPPSPATMSVCDTMQFIEGVDVCQGFWEAVQQSTWGMGDKRTCIGGYDEGLCTNAASFGSCSTFSSLKVLGVKDMQPCLPSVVTEDLKKGQVSKAGVGVWFLIWAFVFVVGLVSQQALAQWTQIRIRLNITKTLHEILLGQRKLYEVVIKSDIDNHDQRITEGVDLFIKFSVGSLIGGFDSPFFSVIYYFFFGTFSLEASTHELSSLPGVMGVFVGLALGCALVSLIVYQLAMNRMTYLLYLQKWHEGNFRWVHSRTITHSATIAMYGGESEERVHADRAFQPVVANFLKYIHVSSLIKAIRHMFEGISSPICIYFIQEVGICGWKVVNTYLTLGAVYSAIAALPMAWSTLANAGGPCHRVGELIEGLNQMEGVNDKNKKTEGAATTEQVSCDNVGFKLPKSDKELFSGLNFNLPRGKSMCITGPSGCGKTTLLRVIAGLWQPTSGTCIRPEIKGRDGIFFVPQRPYLYLGSLRGQMTYPKSYGDGDEDARLAALLKLVELDWLLQTWSLDEVINWPEVLSGGEMQRIGFARMFFHNPHFVIMDEATSALDIPIEARLLFEIRKRGISMISVVHRESTLPFHGMQLHFKANKGTTGISGNWVLTHLDPAEQARLLKAAEFSSEAHLNRDAVKPNAARLSIMQKRASIAPIKLEEQKTGTGRSSMLPKVVHNRESARVRLVFALTFTSWTSKPSLMLYGLMLLGVLNGVLMIFVASFSGELIFDIIATDCGIYPIAKTFLPTIMAAFFMGLMTGPTTYINTWLATRLSLYMRQAITEKMHDVYFRPKVPYVLSVESKDIDTIDQRLTEDVDTLSAVADAALFGGRHPQYPGIIPGTMTAFVYLAYTFTLSALLTGIILGTICVCLIIVFLLVPGVARKVEGVAEAEGLFRTGHSRVREYTESIAFFGGEDNERKELDKRADDVYKAKLAHIVAYVPQLFFMILQAMSNIVLPYGLLSVLKFYTNNGPRDTKDYVASMFMFGKVGFYLAEYGMSYTMLGTFAGLVDRTSELMETCDANIDYDKKIKMFKFNAADRIELVDIATRTPDKSKQLLKQKLSIVANKGNSLLIMGPSGCGKSSLLKVIAGLWKPAHGTTLSPEEIGKGGILFLPQRSYTTEGNIKAQIVYPLAASEHPISDDETHTILEMVDLDHLISRFGFKGCPRWDTVLSGGEAQRLGFARLFFHNPNFCVMDESTSSVNPALARKLMQEVRNRGIVTVSVSHDPKMMEFHDQVIMLKTDGSYTVSQCEHGLPDSQL